MISILGVNELHIVVVYKEQGQPESRLIYITWYTLCQVNEENLEVLRLCSGTYSDCKVSLREAKISASEAEKRTAVCTLNLG